MQPGSEDLFWGEKWVNDFLQIMSRWNTKLCKSRIAGCIMGYRPKCDASMRQFLPKLIMLVAVAAVCASGVATPAKDKPVSWKIIDDALFRVNDTPVKEWGVYQTGKKRDPLLLQVNNRFLLLRIHDRQVFEVDPGKVQRKTDELLWDPSDHSAQLLATSDWDASDTEAVYRIRAKISNEDRLLDIELPHLLDLSGMSPHMATSTRGR